MDWNQIKAMISGFKRGDIGACVAGGLVGGLALRDIRGIVGGCVAAVAVYECGRSIATQGYDWLTKGAGFQRPESYTPALPYVKETCSIKR